MNFTVIDRNTGEYPDLWEIALNEEWAKGLMYCDMEGFYIGEDGSLMLADECGNYAFCPLDRFDIKIEELKPDIRGEWILQEQKILDFRFRADIIKCSKCGREEYRTSFRIPKFCPNCGADMRGEQ